jgi:drug/metabolite transporter (DMT)-like permease
MKTVKRGRSFYLRLSVLIVALGAPASMITKAILNQGFPDIPFMALRYGLVALVCVPAIWQARKAIRANWKLVVATGILVGIAVFCHTPSVRLSTASYNSTIHLLSPIIFIITSAVIYREKLVAEKMLAVTIAMAGAFIAVGLPALTGGDMQFYPEATVLIFINLLTFNIAVVYWRKLTEAGLSLAATIGATFFPGALMAMILTPFSLGSAPLPHLEMAEWAGVLMGTVYLGVMVTLVIHMLDVLVYKNVGPYIVSTLGYIQKLLAILLPIWILGEMISLHLMIGAFLIIASAVLVDIHKHRKPKRKPIETTDTE